MFTKLYWCDLRYFQKLIVASFLIKMAANQKFFRKPSKLGLNTWNKFARI